MKTLKRDAIQVNKEQLQVAIDEGIQYGIGCFETIKVTNYAIDLEGHLSRLNQSLKALEIDVNVPYKVIEEIIDAHAIKDCLLKLIVTPENAFMTTRNNHYLAPDFLGQYTLTVASHPVFSKDRMRRHKTLHYGHNIMALKHARHEGYDDALFLNEKGHVTETSIANVFYIKEGQIVTSPLEEGLLNGTMRQWVIDNYNVNEVAFTLENIMDADSVFVTNAAMGIQAVNRINSKVFTPSNMIQEMKEGRQAFEKKPFVESQANAHIPLQNNIDINQIIKHPLYLKHYALIQAYEEKRPFCGHNMTHFMDVARIAMILNYESGLNIAKDLVYATALLHDIGRGLEYQKGIKHDISSFELAQGILEDLQVNEGLKRDILLAISNHRNAEIKNEKSLSGILYRADKLSRPCYACQVEDQCNWSKSKKNLQISF